MSRKPGVARECQHPGSPHGHGRECYVFDHCRCALGRAWSASDAGRRRKQQILGMWQPSRVDATGTRRRLQALMTLGYDSELLCERIGVSRRTAYVLNLGKQPRVARSTSEAFSSLYAELLHRERVGTSKAERIAVSMTKGRAVRRGYLPPDAWELESMDDPAAEPNLLCLAGMAKDYPLEIRMQLAGQIMREFPATSREEVAERSSLSPHTVRRLARGEYAA